MDYQVVFHPETLGVTQPALQALRNELAKRIDHHICVMRVPAGGSLEDLATYGIFIFDQDARELVIIGDGFRGDGLGEGGAGHRAAQALLAIYGIRVEEALPEDAVDYRDDIEMYRQLVKTWSAIVEEWGFSVPAANRPRYPEWVYARR